MSVVLRLIRYQSRVAGAASDEASESPKGAVLTPQWLHGPSRRERYAEFLGTLDRRSAAPVFLCQILTLSREISTAFNNIRGTREFLTVTQLRTRDLAQKS